MNHDFDVAFHCLWIGLDWVSLSSFNIENFTTLKVEFLKINLLAFDTRPSPLARADTVMCIPQGGIITQAADDMESHQAGFTHELCLWEPCVCNDITCYAQQLILVFAEHVKIPVHKAVIFALLFQIRLVRCLFRTQRHTVPTVNVDNADTENFQTSFHSRSASRPELANIRSLLSRLWNVARVYGNGFSSIFTKPLPHKKEIELHPVKLTFKQLPEALFRTVRVTAHLGEIYLSWQCHIQNHELDECCFKTFA